MAVLTFNKVFYTVDHAVKGADYVHGYDANGSCIVSILGIKNFSLVTYNGVYLAPEECITEGCNDLKYIDGVIKTADGRTVPMYGLGTFGKYVASPDEATVNGFYMTPAPGEIASGGNMRGVVLASSASYATQLWSMNGAMIKRELSAGEWGPYEWFNPPMKASASGYAEYRTTERFMGLPVYQSVIDFGALPNAGAKIASFRQRDPKYVLDVFGSTVDSNGLNGTSLEHTDGIESVTTYGMSVAVETSKDLSSRKAYIVVKYAVE